MASKNPHTIPADQISDLIPVFHSSGITPMFIGTPGIGKTALVREGAKIRGQQLAQQLGHPVDVAVRELHLASMSEVDVRGFLVPVTDAPPAPTPGVPPLPFGAQPKTVTRSTFTQPEFWREVEANPYGILFLDEFPQATHEVQKAVAPLLLEGRIGEYVLPAGWSVVLAGNGIDDGAGANTTLTHVINRIAMIEVGAPDPEVWQSWAMANEVPFELVTYAKLKPTSVFNADIPAEPDTPYCTARSITRLGALSVHYPGGIRAMVASPAGQAAIAGMVGRGAAAELVGVINMAINLPSYEEVIANPERIEIPKAMDQRYAMMIMVATRAKLEHAQQVCAYLTRFDANHAIAGIVALVRRNLQFAANPLVTAWVMANQGSLTKFNKYIVGSLSR